MGIIKPEFAATSTSACSCGLGMFAYVKRYVPEAIIVLQTATFCNRIRGYIRCPQFSFRGLLRYFFIASVRISDRFLALLLAVLFSLSSVTFSHRFSFCSYSVSYSLHAVLNLIVFVLCLKCLIVSSSSLILVSTTVCHYYVLILLVISISQIHRLVGKTPLIIFIYYF